MRFLYDYQIPAAEKFLDRGNLLCALDTGGGKTAISIAVAEELLEMGKVDRVLIVCPTGLKEQWAQALAQFTDLSTMEKKIKNERITIAASPGCVIIDGTPDKKSKQYKEARTASEYVIVGYDNIVDEWRDIKRLRADFVILDEAAAIKSFTSGRAKHFKQHVTPPYRMALTATPIENKPEELFSIMEWVDADVLGDAMMFDMAYIDRDYSGKVISYKNLDVLHEKIDPALFRLSIEDSELDAYLPDRDRKTWTVPLGAKSRSVYNEIGWQLVDAIDDLMPGAGFDLGAYYAGRKSSVGGQAGNVAGLHTVLAMFLDSPNLVTISGRKYQQTSGEHGSKTATDWLDKVFQMHGQKLEYLLARMKEISFKDPNAKFLIFSQYTEMVTLIAEAVWDALPLTDSGVIYTGKMTKVARSAAKAKFQQDPNCRVMVLSDAGGVGMDLPQANWLINYDLPWSHGKKHQRDGRHVRASSKHKIVHIVDMVCERTIEERVQANVAFKESIADAVIDGRMKVSARLQNDVSTLREYLLDTLDPR